MFCQKCGTKNPDTAKFCSNCATRLITEASAAPENAPPENSPKSSKKPLVLIISIVLALSVCAVGLIGLSDLPRPESQKREPKEDKDDSTKDNDKSEDKGEAPDRIEDESDNSEDIDLPGDIGNEPPSSEDPDVPENEGSNAPSVDLNEAIEQERAAALEAAATYLRSMYRYSQETTPTDFVRVGTVTIDGVSYPVEWTADSDTIKIFPYSWDNNLVTIDVDERNPDEVIYTLTAIVRDSHGNSREVSFTHRVPASIIILDFPSYEEIVNAAYKLETGVQMEGTFRLFGTITKIDTPWSDDYQNLTVTIVVGDLTDKPIMCYRLKGEGAKDLAIGDTITVEGVLKNYKGTIEFDAGCILIGMGEIIDQSAILDAAYSLEVGIKMEVSWTLTGEIIKIDTPWSDDYQNLTVTIVCDGDAERPIMCYRLKGEGAKDLRVGDVITVTGFMKNYNGTIEFDAGCTLDRVG